MSSGYGRQYAWHTGVTFAAAIATGLLFYVLRRVLYAHLSIDDYGLFYVLFSAAMAIHPALSLVLTPALCRS